MTEQRQQPESDGMAASDPLPDNFGSNGTHREAAVAIADTPGTEAPTPDDATTPLEAPAEVEEVVAERSAEVEQVVPEDSAEVTEVVAQEPAAIATESPQDVTAPDDGTAFLAELARAMQETAGVERTRIDEDIERRRTAHLETIRARRESGAASIRDLAAKDLNEIDDWAQAEHQRINLERKDRATALETDLDASLAEHGSRIDTEIEGVEAAIAGYRTEVDGYFATIEAAKDPVEIAQHAARRPVFPDLEGLLPAQSESAETAPDAPSVAVMDPESAADPATAWARWNETGALPKVTVPAATPAPSSGEGGQSGPLLQSTPASRPYGAYRETDQDH